MDTEYSDGSTDETFVPPVEVRISVRDFVEFLTRSGDIDNRSSGRDADAMLEGARLHRKIQKAQPVGYRAEVSMQHTEFLTYEGQAFAITVEGRADGIYEDETYGNTIDEIKCLLRDVNSLTEPVPVHLAQARCYAYMEAVHKEYDSISVRMTYCHIETGAIRYFYETDTISELTEWYHDLCRAYCRFAKWEHDHRIARNATVSGLAFPFPYRPGQKELVTNVYRTVLRKRKLFIEAPTGVGKTISTVYPTVRSMAEGLTEKIFYLTAKTIARTVAEESFDTLIQSGASLLTITLTAKEKLCILDKPNCNPAACARAKGHFDRVNEALFDMLSSVVGQTGDTPVHRGGSIKRETILQYAEAHCVCPYELSLDLALFADAVICDYNYVFDPTAYLRRFFGSEGVTHDYVFLIDEAHNLVDRSREMYSATLVKEEFLACKRALEDHFPYAAKACNATNKVLLNYKHQCDGFTVIGDPGDLILSVMRCSSALEDVLASRTHPIPDEAPDLYFKMQHFMAMYEQQEDNYTTYCDFTENNDFFLRLQCMDASAPLSRCLEKGRSAVFFSATLLPIAYYKEQLGGAPDDYAVYAPSPFRPENRLVMIANDVSTRYKHRTDDSYDKIADYIRTFCEAKCGNYMAFFPSYRFAEQVAERLTDFRGTLLVQKTNMTETEREEFLNTFRQTGPETLLGFCVMGGIFSEGIDLRNDSLIGAVVVGPGLPMVCNENELFRNYYESHTDRGFEYAYLYPGMNKVLQAAGRVIRTVDDVGSILLLDDRFTSPAYRSLFPNEWTETKRVTVSTVSDTLNTFWNRHRNSADSPADTCKNSPADTLADSASLSDSATKNRQD